MREPRWLTREMVDAFHDREVRKHGGPPGTRDEGGIESALARPKNRWAYEQADLLDLAAAYAFGLARNHGYLDGNKRVAFVSMDVFLKLNGHHLTASEPEAVVTTLAVAAGELAEADLAAWARTHSEPR